MKGDLFCEEQRFANKWTIGLAMISTAVTVGLFGWGMVWQLALGHGWGSKPMSDTALAIVGTLAIIFTLVLSGAVVLLRMTTRVEESHVTVRFWGVRIRRVPLRDIVECEAVSVNSLREYGGWGIRWRPGHGWVYNVASGGAVRLSLNGGKRLVIGSQRAKELAEAISKGIAHD